MKITIEFDTEDSSHSDFEMRCHQEGFNLWSCLYDIMQAMRQKRKHGQSFSQEDFENFEKDCWEIVHDKGFNLDGDDRP